MFNHARLIIPELKKIGFKTAGIGNTLIVCEKLIKFTRFFNKWKSKPDNY